MSRRKDGRRPGTSLGPTPAAPVDPPYHCALAAGMRSQTDEVAEAPVEPRPGTGSW
jgi:hypothetical protein